MHIFNERPGPTHTSSEEVDVQANALHPFEPGSHPRILIIAPHPDDEALAAGGVIATAIKLGSQVRVLVITNGDASYATALTRGSHFITRANFRRLAIMRQRESLNALVVLGLCPEQVHFLGFPDRGLASLWNIQWDDRHPYRSFTTGHSRSQQALNSPVVGFTGANLVRLLQSELLKFCPTTVIMPHPQDHHSDHSALAGFTRRAVAQYHLQSRHSMPVMLSYWMWSQNRPWLTGARPHGLVPSHALASTMQPDLQLTLRPEIQAQKVRALLCYPSQKIPAGKIFREALHRKSETFTPFDGSFNNG
jgi:LmbE family N-acetylglucosaminyl deacetylase